MSFFRTGSTKEPPKNNNKSQTNAPPANALFAPPPNSTPNNALFAPTTSFDNNMFDLSFQPVVQPQSEPSTNPSLSTQLSAPVNNPVPPSENNVLMQSQNVHPNLQNSFQPFLAHIESSNLQPQIQVPNEISSSFGGLEPLSQPVPVASEVPPVQNSNFPSANPLPEVTQPPPPQAQQPFNPYPNPNNPAPIIPQVRPHWFYLVQEQPQHRPHPANLKAPYPPKPVELHQYNWLPFSRYDSDNLENTFIQIKNEENNPANIYGGYSSAAKNKTVSTDGGRFEVDISTRQRKACFWNEKSTNVVRVTWFFRTDGEYKYTPFDEELADVIEKFYLESCAINVYPQRKVLEKGNILIVHSPDVVIQALEDEQHADDAVGPPTGPKLDNDGSQMLVRVLKRGTTDTHFESDIGPGWVFYEWKNLKVFY